jgi:hypothetical protein
MSAEAFSATSDVLLIDTDDLFADYRFWERVRDTALCTVPYVKERQVVVGIEQGDRLQEEADAVA